MTLQPSIDPRVEVSSLWNKDVPLKIVPCVWRLFCDRLPAKDNLLRRGVIDNDSRLCLSGCGFMETSSHLFLHCNHFGAVWYLIYQWMVSPLQVVHHFHHYISAFLRVLLRRVVPSFKLFGLQRCGKFGKKETTGYSMAMLHQLCRSEKRLSPSLSCG